MRFYRIMLSIIIYREDRDISKVIKRRLVFLEDWVWYLGS